MMSLALVGLPQVGKKTLFELLTGLLPDKAPHRGGMAFGIAQVRDPRIDRLNDLYKPKKKRYAEFEIVLPPDVTPEATRAAEWLAPLRNADALLHVVRCFEAANVFHISGSVNPDRDLATVETEFLLADLDLVEKRIERMEHDPKKKQNPNYDREVGLLQRLKTHIEGEKSLRTLPLSDDDRDWLVNLQFLTLKPLVVVFNVGENLKQAEPQLQPLRDRMVAQGATVVFLSAGIEKELRDLSPEEQAAFMQDLGITEPAAHRLSRAAFQCLGLISFFTAGEDEVRAWPVRGGSTAPAAAGKIHTDLERGFIRADTVAYDDLIAAGSEKAAREANKFRLNGKEYIVQDGDIIEIRFNV